MKSPFKYAMGGSPFAELGDDAPGQPVEDVGDLIDARDRFNHMLHSPDLMTDQQLQGNPSGLPPRTYYGGSAGRPGSPQGNADYERANGLELGSLVESNAGRGDVTKFTRPGLSKSPLTDKEVDDAFNRAWAGPVGPAGQTLSAKQAGQVENNQVSAIKGYMTSGNADVNQMKQWMNNPRIAPLVDKAIDGLSDEDFAAFRNNWNKSSPDPDDHFARGGYAFGGSPFNVERAAAIGLQREGRTGFLNSGVPGRTDQIGLQVRNGSYVIPADVVSAAGQGNSLAGASAFDRLLKQGPYGTSLPSIRASRPPMMSMPKPPPAPRMPGGIPGRGINNFGGALKMPKLPGQADGGNVTDMPKNTTDVPKNVPPAKNTWGPGPWQHLDEAARGGAQKKPRELVAPKGGNWSGMSAGGVSHPGASHRIPILAAGGEYIVEPETVARVGGGDQQKGFRILDKLVLLTRKKHIETLRKLKPPKKK